MTQQNAQQHEPPQWAQEKVLPKLSSRVRGWELADDGKTVIIFTEEGVTVATKGALSGPKLHAARYPAGLMLNESNCPHCGQPIVEPVAKIARLKTFPPAEPSPVEGKVDVKAPGKRKPSSKKKR